MENVLHHLDLTQEQNLAKEKQNNMSRRFFLLKKRLFLVKLRAFHGSKHTLGYTVAIMVIVNNPIHLLTFESFSLSH